MLFLCVVGHSVVIMENLPETLYESAVILLWFIGVGFSLVCGFAARYIAFRKGSTATTAWFCVGYWLVLVGVIIALLAIPRKAK